MKNNLVIKITMQGKPPYRSIYLANITNAIRLLGFKFTINEQGHGVDDDEQETVCLVKEIK